ncbi:C9 hydroxylase cytochrome P450 [Actinoplanes sp. N902-109]|uniref:C9 hydroxylase cytochrome P450 n=1 Tax=Actinoplanes sp. (strain N902-109) TaxID=649831 RepID=UPI0003293F92|nr:C9 hydroxylase cytochrome P450 [Actinoplanes sp. N902-109]AGL12175.1 cytochrome P450 [Actinoplanes sp. N902-109]AGL16478.1 cytochrome P450 [Actinoplanes sp. N902-109]
MSTESETPAGRCPFAVKDEHRAILTSGTAGTQELFGIKQWLVAGAEQVKLVTNDPRFSSAAASGMMGPKRAGWFSGMDAPEHTRYRQKIARDFTLRAARKQEEFVIRTADACLDDIEAQGPGADLLPGYARRLPSLAIDDLYGLSVAEGSAIEASMRRIEGGADLDDIMQRTEDFFGDAMELVRVKREQPGDKLLHRLAESGEDGEALSDDEATGVFATLLFAGHDTVQQMLAYCMYALLAHPEQRAKLREDPELIDGAVEELLRYLPINQLGIPRVAVEDVEINGLTINAGDNIAPLYSTANRDPEVFADPDTFDITREPESNFAFGYGIHKCPGQHLARMLIRVAVTRLFARFPDVRLAGEVPMNDSVALFSPAELRVTWGEQ